MATFTINMNTPPKTKAEKGGKTVTLYSPKRSDRKGKAREVFTRKNRNDSIKTVAYGEPGSTRNQTKEQFLRYLTRHLPIKKKDGSLAVNDRTGAAYWALRDLWPNKWGVKSVSIGDDTYRLVNRSVRP